MANEQDKGSDHSNSGHGGGNQGPGGSGNGDHGGRIHIFVNEQPVAIADKKQTGMSIKQAAIAQGVGIQLDFVLSIERGGGKTELVGDDDKINVKDGDRFLAIPNDDNS